MIAFLRITICLIVSRVKKVEVLSRCLKWVCFCSFNHDKINIIIQTRWIQWSYFFGIRKPELKCFSKFTTILLHLKNNAVSFFLFFCFDFLQGHCKSWRTKQYIAADIEYRLHGSSDTYNTAAPPTTISPWKSWCTGRIGERCKSGHFRVSTPIPKSSMELFDEEFFTWQKSIRQNRWSRYESEWKT